MTVRSDLPPSSAASDNHPSRRLPEPIEAAIGAVVLAASSIGEPAGDALATAIGQLRMAIRPSLLPAEMTPEIREVLGLSNFRTGPIAHLYRAAGHEIRPKMEVEQAYVLFRFLHLALQHGPGWFAESCLDLDAAAVAAKLKSEKA